MIHWLLVGMYNTDIVEADDFDDLQRLADSELYHTVVKLSDESIRKIKEALAVGTVRHGKWVKVEHYGTVYSCSYCGELTTETVMGKPRYEYCPMCGAKMDG